MKPEECKKMSSYKRLKIDLHLMEEEAKYWKEEHKKLNKSLIDLLQKIPQMSKEEINIELLTIIILENNGTKK